MFSSLLKSFLRKIYFSEESRFFYIVMNDFFQIHETFNKEADLNRWYNNLYELLFAPTGSYLKIFLI